MDSKSISLPLDAKNGDQSPTAIKTGKTRSENVRKATYKALEEIDNELLGQSGKYLYNNGKLSMAEVARRAGIHPTTFYSPNQKELGNFVRDWLIKIQDISTSQDNQKNKRRRPAERIADLQRVYESTCQQQRITELELQECESKLAKANRDIALLHNQIERLTRALNATSGVILPFFGDT